MRHVLFRAVLLGCVLAPSIEAAGAQSRTRPPVRGTAPRPVPKSQQTIADSTAPVSRTDCGRLSGEAKEDCQADAMDRALAEDVSLLLMHSMAKDRKVGTPLSIWIDAASARCSSEDCVGQVTFPLSVNGQVSRLAYPFCIQPLRLVRRACRELLERATQQPATINAAVQAGHRLLTTFNPRERQDAIGLLDRYSARINTGSPILRAELWLRTAALAEDNGLSFAKYRDLLAGTLREASAPDSAVRQVLTATQASELWQSDTTRTLQRVVDATNTDGAVLSIPPGSSAEEMIAARGLALQLVLSMERFMSLSEAIFSDQYRWILGRGATTSRQRNQRRNEKADEETNLDELTGPWKYLMAGTLTRLFGEIMNIGMLKGMSGPALVRTLEFQTALVTRYIVNRCGSEVACTDGLFEVLRSTKGLLALSYGSSLPASRAMLIELRPEDEVEVGEAFRVALQRATERGKMDSVAFSGYAIVLRRILAQRQQQGSPRMSVPDREILQTGEAFVDILRSTPTVPGEPRRYVAFVIAKGVPTRAIELGTQVAIDRLVEGWRGATRGSPRTSGSMEPAAQALFENVWRPIAEALPAGTQRIFFSPDGRMLRVNWPLIAELGAATQSLSTIPSWSLLIGMRRYDTPKASPRAMLATAPNFGVGSRFPPVEASPQIDAYLRGAGLQVDALSADDATKASVSAGIQRSQISVLLSHGTTPQNTYDSLSTFLDRTYLALSRANVDPDARLSATEFARLDLRGTKLLVLAACRLGDGAVLEGQGVIGFPLALAAAGAPTALVSLWPAPNDASTSLLIETFVEQVMAKNATYAEALRTAQAKVRAEYPSEPMRWAGWTITGDAFGRLR